MIALARIIETSIQNKMQRTAYPTVRQSDPEVERGWLELGKAGIVDVTSEAEGCPVEATLLSDGQRGWRADAPGPQTNRLLFDHPITRTIGVIRLVFKEDESFVLRSLCCASSPMEQDSWRDVVRQQWNFGISEFQILLCETGVFLMNSSPCKMTLHRLSFGRLLLQHSLLGLGQLLRESLSPSASRVDARRSPRPCRRSHV